jgi:hypothetical protein
MPVLLLQWQASNVAQTISAQNPETLQKLNNSVTLVHIVESLRGTPMNSRSYTIDEQGKLNNFATEPQMYVDENVQTGFTAYSEKMNGRLAMIGFVVLVLTEALSGHSLVSLLTGL